MPARPQAAPRHRRWPCRILMLSTLALACGRDARAPDAAPSVGGDPRDLGVEDCALVDASGRADPVKLHELADPVASLVLRGGCPADLAAVIDKLSRVDAEGCDGDMFPPDRTTMISEIAALRGVPGGDLEGCTSTPAAIYRGVMQRTCGGRQPWELLFSVAPMATVAGGLPTDLEAIGWDPKRKELAFYTLEEGTWRFFGHSRDMLRGPADTGERRCAACHVAGGLTMKELDPPWLHWEGRLTIPGIDALLSEHPGLGSRTEGKVIDFRPAGKELEEAIAAGNAAWMRTRVAHLRAEGTTRELLRPLFCTVELNLGAASDAATPPTATAAESGALELPPGLFFDPRLQVPGRLPVPLADYHAAIAATGQRMEWSCGARLVDGDGRAIVDTPFDLAYPHRARIDVQHVDALVEAGVIDEDLALAVLGVDATRPIFSSDRCGLLERIPELPPEQRDAERIRAALAAAVAEAPVGDRVAAELRDNLERPRAVKARVAAFMDACARRPPSELSRDAVRFTSWLREEARKQPLLEFRESLPVDDLKVTAGTRFDLSTCELVEADEAL